MTRVQFEGAAIYASEQTRTVSGLLLPFDEVGATNLGRVSVAADAVPDPDDLSILAVNVEHDQLRPAARFTSLQRMAAGFYCSLAVGVGQAGDALLAAVRDGSLGRLSVELADVVVHAGVVTSARLAGAAFVARGAFPSAAILAAEHPDLEAGVELEGDAGGAEVECATCGSSLAVVGGSLEHHEDGSHTFTPTPDPVTTDPDPEAAAAAHTTEEHPMPAPTLPASIAATLQPLEAAASTTPPTTSPQAVLQAVFAAHAEARRTRSSAPMEALLETAADASRLFAALKDVTFDGSSGLAPTMAQPQWLGHLWEARRVRRRIIPLIGSGTLTGMAATGWKWKTRPEMKEWAANKTAIPSNTVEVEPFEVAAQPFAGAHDVDIRYRHFDVPGFWEGYYQSMTDSYASLSDAKAFADLVAAATYVAPGVVPTGTSKALTYIVDGALSFIDDVLPTFALVSKDLWRELILTPHDNRLAYLDAAFGLEDGTLGQTSFRIQPAPLAADTVVVGVKEAAQWFELGETPIRVEGLDVVKGGIDPAVFGYGATVIHDARAIAKVSGTAPAGGA